MGIRSAAALLVLAGCAGTPPAPEEGARYVVDDRALHRIDDRLFGHFMERPSWGETGIEAAVRPGTRELQPGVLERLRQMRIPVLRFPGGTDIDYTDWRDMIDRAPGRDGPRPATKGHQGHSVTNRFGHDEFLALCEELGSEAILVLNFGDALLRRKPAAEAARDAAGLVAYANAPVGAKLPAGMPDWPAVRAANGRAKPYAARYVQIGNETWFFLPQMKKKGEKDAEAFYVECLEAYVAAVQAVDPKAEVLVDAASERIADLIRERLGGRVKYLVQHHYMPWAIKEVLRGGEKVPPSRLSPEEVWYAWVAVPGEFNERGESVIGGPAVAAARKHGYRVAETEWNWNGWWGVPTEERPLDSGFAKAAGAAGYLHAFMRAGDVIDLACQSMTVGHRWGITCIHVDPEGKTPPYFMPTGQLTMFYALHHGNELLALSAEDVPVYAQPYRMGGFHPQAKVAVVDLLVTRGPKAVYVHALNRHFRDAQPVRVDLRALGRLGEAVVHHVFEGSLRDEPREVAGFSRRQACLEGGVLRAALPPRSVSCFEIPRP